MKSWIIAICMLILGIVVGFLIASRRPAQIQMAFTDVGDLFLHPKKGDKITWTNQGQPLAVKFKSPNPCTNANDPAAGTCTIQATSGFYFYDCQGCPDPGIGVGSDVILGQSTARSGILPQPYATPPSPKVSCDSSGKATADPISGKSGDSFQFLPNGDLTFSITFAANTCTQGDSPSNGASDCTLKAGATSQPAYPIHVNGCTDGTGSLKINQ